MPGGWCVLLPRAELRDTGDGRDASLPGPAWGIEFQFTNSMHPALGLVAVADDAVFLIESLAPAENFVLEVVRHYGVVVGMD